MRAKRKRRPGGKTAKAIYSALTRITEAVSRARDLQELFQAIHAIVAELMPAKNFYIAFKEQDEGGHQYVSFPFFQDESDPAPEGWVPLKKSFTGYVIRTGQPLLASDKIARRLVTKGQKQESLGTESAIWLGVPLKTKDQTIGAVVVQNYDRRDAYDENDKQILSFISGQIAIAIELMRYRQKLEEAVRQRTQELLEERQVQDVLFEISQSVYSAADLTDFLETVRATIGRLMDARNFYVALYDPETGQYRFPCFRDEFDRVEPHARENLRHSLTDFVRLNGPLLADHAAHGRLIRKGEVAGVVGTDSQVWLGVPLLVPGKSQAIGVMAVQSYEDRRRYTEKEKKILMNVSTTVALAIDRISIISDLFHHFNNAVTAIQGNAEILLTYNGKEAEWLEKLKIILQRHPWLPPGDKNPAVATELEPIVQFLLQARENSENRIGKIIEGVEEASRRMNFFFAPLLRSDSPGGSGRTRG